MSGADWWWWPGQPAPNQRPVLFFPPAGAEQTIVRPLLPHVAALRFGVLRMPGRGTRHAEPAPTRLPDLVTAVAASIVAMPGPAPVLVGHSFGGLFAFGVAAALVGTGKQPPALVAVASTAPVTWAAELAHQGITFPPGPDGTPSRVPPYEQLDQFVPRRVALLQGLGVIPSEVAADGSLAAAARELMTVDITLAACRFDLAPLPVPITVLNGRDDGFVPPSATAGWAQATTAGCHQVTVPGDHFPYRSHPAEVAALLAGEVAHLDGAYA